MKEDTNKQVDLDRDLVSTGDVLKLHTGRVILNIMPRTLGLFDLLNCNFDVSKDHSISL